MSFHQRNRNISGNSFKKVIIPILAIILITVVFSVQSVRDFIFFTGTPLWHLKNNIVNFTQDNLSLLSSKSALIKENISLKNELESKKNDQVLMELIRQENIDLKNILNRKKGDQKLILSSILVKPFLSIYDTLILDVGSSSNVKINDKVLANGDTFIGYISEVYENSSKAVLFSSFGEKVKVLIGNNNIEKEATGLGSGNFKIEITKEINIKEGDRIILPSISPNVLGIVEKIDSKESDSMQTILFKMPVNVFELKWVEILSDNKK